MIERLQNLPAGIDGVSAKGKVRAEDYREVVRPLFEKARSEDRRLKFLYHVDKDADFGAGAALEDARLGLSSLRVLQRCAIVSDATWMQNAGRFAGALAPCPVRVYGEGEWDQAVAWLSEVVEPTRVPHELLPEQGVLVVRPERPISTADLESIGATVDAWLEVNGTLNGIVIQTEQFPGWESIGSFFGHAQFLRDHHQQVRRVALVMDGKLPELASTVGARFIKAEVKHFPHSEHSVALEWVKAAKPAEEKGATS